MAKQARELIVCNISDMSGNPSKFPHTVMAATFLSASSLKTVMKDCISETKNMIENHVSSSKVLNIGCDGESLHLVCRTSTGKPGTLLSLTKHLFDLCRSFSKPDLARMLAVNQKIKLSDEALIIEEVDEEIMEPADDMNNLYDTIANVMNEKEVVNFSLDDIETWLTDSGNNEVVDPDRDEICKKMKKEELKMVCVKYILPNARKVWLQDAYGTDKLIVNLGTEQFEYSPSTLFEKSEQGHFITVTFDMAHLSNLLREAAAKNKLKELGMTSESLHNLSNKDGFAYLKPILSLKGSKLEYDPMNQKSSSLCFSEKTEEGLAAAGDLSGSALCRMIRLGIIEALDKSGISSEERIRNICRLKAFLEDKINPADRIKRPGPHNISNELLQMIGCSLDSHIVTFLNMSHFNARRKSTLTCEQFFGMMTLMADGGRKLDCKQISGILERCMITNALRMTPEQVKGFQFLNKMRIHMTSYKAEAENDELENTKKVEYPRLTSQRNVIIPSDSFQDQQCFKRKRKMAVSYKSADDDIGPCDKVRRFHKKFS